MNPELLKRVIEAALMAVTEPLSMDQLVSLFAKDTAPPERDAIRAALKALQEEYAQRGVVLCEVASGFRFQVHSDCAEWVNKLFDERPQRYSRALLETLAIIAYRQPLTRGEIEDIRGVSVSSNILRTLQEREWIRVVGHRDVPGKPELLATTKPFLDYFGLKKLSDLPSLSEIKDFDQINPDLFEALEKANAGKENNQAAQEGDAAEIGLVEVADHNAQTDQNEEAAAVEHAANVAVMAVDNSEADDNDVLATAHAVDETDASADADELEEDREVQTNADNNISRIDPNKPFKLNFSNSS